MATHSSILAWKIPWAEEPGGLQSMGRKESDMTEQLSLFHQAFAMICSSKNSVEASQGICADRPSVGSPRDQASAGTGTGSADPAGQAQQVLRDRLVTQRTRGGSSCHTY